jgi:hypothetical protein
MSKGARFKKGTGAFCRNGSYPVIAKHKMRLSPFSTHFDFRPRSQKENRHSSDVGPGFQTCLPLSHVWIVATCGLRSRLAGGTYYILNRAEKARK